MIFWNEHQKRCLKELGIPLWDYQGTTTVPESPSNENQSNESQSHESKSPIKSTFVEPVAADNTDTEVESVSLDGSSQSLSEQELSQQKSPEQESPEQESPEQELAQTVPQQKPAIYRLAHWYLRFPEPMPGTGFTWVRDLGKAYDDRATQISDAPAQANVVDCSDYMKSNLTPEQKRTLWNRLKDIAASTNS